MITINDNSVQQINTALLRLNNVVDMDVSKLDTDISNLASKLQRQIDDIKAGTIIYSAGPHINISTSGVISVIDVNKTLTLKRNGVTLGSYVGLAINDTTVDIQVPTKTSDLTNDSDFVVDANYVHTDNNFTTTLKNKLNGIAAGAEVNVQADWNVTNTSSDAYIKNKPTIPAAQVQSDWTQTNTSAVDYIKNKPTIPAAQIQSDWTQTNTSAVDYIKNKPTIPAAQVNSDWNATSGVAEILNKPTALSDFTNDLDVSDFPNDVGYITGDYIYPYYFYSTTAYNTAAKTATSPQSNTEFTLVNNTRYLVYMQGSNGGGSSTARTMNLNNTGAVPMYLGEHVAAITGQFQMDSGLYIFVYHSATETVEAYFQVRPVVYRTLCAYQIQGNNITVENTQYNFNKNFSFELTCQTNTTNTVTLNNWAGQSVTATCVVNGNTTSGIPNGYRGIAFFYYDATNGHKLYIASDFINIYGLAVGSQSSTSNNHGTIPIQLRNTLSLWGGQYRDETHDRYGLNLGNSDIIGVNGFYTNDSAGSYSEGINFYRNASTVDGVTHYYTDSIYANTGHFYFGANVERIDTKGSATTGAQNSDAILHASELVGIAKSAGIYVLTATDDYAAAKTLTFVSGNDKLKAGYTYTFYIPRANKCFSQPTVTYDGTTYNIVTNRTETGYPNYNNYARAFGHGVYVAYVVSSTIYLIRATNEPLFSILINPSNGAAGCCVASLDFENGEVFDLYCDGVTLGAGTILYSTSTVNNATDAIYYNNTLLAASTTIARGYYKAKIVSNKLYFYDQDKWTYDEVVEGVITKQSGDPDHIYLNMNYEANKTYTVFVSFQPQGYLYEGSLIYRPLNNAENSQRITLLNGNVGTTGYYLDVEFNYNMDGKVGFNMFLSGFLDNPLYYYVKKSN